MSSFPALPRRLAIGGIVLVLAVGGFEFALKDFSGGALCAVGAEESKKAEHSWPMFGGTLSRNLVNLTDTNIPTTWSVRKPEKNIKWSTQLGSKAYGGPVFSGGKIFIGTNNNVPRNQRDLDTNGDPIDKGVMMCFRESDGEFLWQYVSDKLPAGQVNDWPKEGICSSPVVDGKHLYFVSNRCEVLCCTTEGLAAGNEGVQDEKYTTKTDADIVWRLDMMKELGVFPHNLATCSPLLVGDTLFLITSNGVDEKHKNIPAPDAPSFLALDKNTGKVLWKDNSPGRDIMHGQWSNPVYADPGGKPMIIFPGGDGWIRAFNPKTGQLLWKFDCNPKDAVYVLGPEGTKNDFVSTPIVWKDKLYIGVGQDPEHKKGVGHLWCINIAKEPKNKELDLSPATKPGAKAGDPPLTILDPKDPLNKDSGLVWHHGGFIPSGTSSPYAEELPERTYLFGRTMSTCCIHDGRLYAAEFDRLLHCFDAETGKEHWHYDLKADTWSSPYYVDGKIYLGNEFGKITIFKDSATREVLGTVDMGRGALVRATPVVVNGVMYVISENPCKLWAIANK
jgi:outer membrane protein assembly factor BamB